MDSFKQLDKMIRQMEREKRLHPPAPPAPPRELWPVYFDDPLRPRLSPIAHLVWDCLLLRADPESRIASLSLREIKHVTGLRSNQSLHQALAELARLGYVVPSTFPTGHCQPRTYKIPKHITPTRFNHPEVERLRRQADQPRRSRRNPPPRLADPTPHKHNPTSFAPPPPPLPDPTPAPTPSENPQLPNLPALNLEEKVAQATKEVDMILNLLNQHKKP